MQPTKEEIAALRESMIGKIAAEIIEDAGGADAVLSSLKSNDGFGKLFGNIGTKLESKVKSGTLDENTLLREATQMSTTLPSMVPMEDLKKVTETTSTATATPETESTFSAFASILKKYLPSTRK